MKKIINLRESGKFLKNNLFPLKTMKNRTPVRDLKEKFGCGLLKKSGKGARSPMACRILFTPIPRSQVLFKKNTLKTRQNG
jgi:hypothetical protein